MIKINGVENIIVIERKDVSFGCADLIKRSGIMDNTHGIYRLYDSEGVLLYIGKSKCAIQRVLQHMKGQCPYTKSISNVIERAEILILSPKLKSSTETIEQYLIKILKPKLNQRKWSDETILGHIKYLEV